MRLSFSSAASDAPPYPLGATGGRGAYSMEPADYALVPASIADRAYDDAALPIGHGQTISQPFIVAAMCELLSLDGTEFKSTLGANNCPGQCV